jgi:outer membrane protein assembly factor BamB
LVAKDDELQIIGVQSVTHISLASGDSRVETFGPAGAKLAALAQNNAGGGLSGTGTDNGQGLDPKKVEAQAQNLNLQGRIALPALLSNQQYEQQLENALNDDLQHPHPKAQKSAPADAEYFLLVPGESGYAEFGFLLLEEHKVTHSAMKASPKKSVLDGNLNASQTGDAANEILNDMQRNAGGDTVTEDQSRYQVTVHLPDATSTADWTSEVVGPPQLFVLKTVNVVAAGKTVIVLDKSNKKLWEATLTYPVSSGDRGLFLREQSPYGEGPCVEHGDTLYVFDQAVLTAYDLNSGNARWRLPSIGVVGLFFDGQGDVYVNTTTGNPDDIKYSRQIDVTRNTEAVVSKVDAKTGKTLWSIKPGGFVSYLSGKFIYVVQCYDPNPTDADVINDMIASSQKPAFLRIARIRPSDGKIMWEYYDRERCPVNWRFDANNIELIFKREVQVLHYLTL